MGKYCCFFCPSNDYEEKELADSCPACERSYGFVLNTMPVAIGPYIITKALARGFYGSAYIAETGPFNKKFVIKVSPVAFYDFFSKPSFDDETRLHNELAQNAEHVVGIFDRFTTEIQFGDRQDDNVTCHVTVLDFVDGEPLQDYIDGKLDASSATICQIAVDLLRLRGELEANQLNHNDLHANNLIVERLPARARRQNAIEDTIRVKAIDLGSLGGVSKSNVERHGDLYFIGSHVNSLLARLLATPAAVTDRDYRAALALQGVANGLLASVQNARHPNFSDLIVEVEEAYYRVSKVWKPWNSSLKLKSFADHYNAQTLGSSDVPKLLVDPQNHWLAEVSKPGPQIITGMRGCGKTMLLRALDIHAQAAAHDGESKREVLVRLREAGFIGLFVSAQRLLELSDSATRLEQRLSRLYVHYSLQAARALSHLHDIEPTSLVPGAHATLANAIADYLEGGEDVRLATSVDDLEARLERVAVLMSRSPDNYVVRQAPAEVFQHLAERLRACSEIIAQSTVLFLLDDVSSRYLPLDKVEELLSGLLFQSPVCAFKFTSEWQTIELGLQSPGRIHPIRDGRDLVVFDLGAEVFQTINASGKDKGTDFVAQILQQRSKFHSAHPNHSPRDLLGDVPLETVAREIASSEVTSKDRKTAYRGLSCLTSVCVGDIGDVIKLYEEIIKRASTGRNSIPIPINDSTQAECFQAISSRRLYDLNRRGGFFKSHALAFAEAARELLGRSYRKKSANGKPQRLRQYSSIYVRITSDDAASSKQQIDQLRDLIDAGVFVYSGGSARTKTKDSDPIQQFKLSYRKIYGLASYIGLADRDRFELSGADLAKWLASPDKEILLRNQIGAEAADGSLPENVDAYLEVEDSDSPPKAFEQHSLFDRTTAIDIGPASDVVRSQAASLDVRVRELLPAALSKLGIESVLCGLGFEERTLASNSLLARSLSGTRVLAVKYDRPGYSDQILQEWEEAGSSIAEIDYATACNSLPELPGKAIIDISGLSKPIIFASIRRELMDKGMVYIAHVSAEQHYPLHQDLEPLFEAERAHDPLLFLESLGAVLKGEDGPYRDMGLLSEEIDLSRSRALLAFASPKHERLFSLLDNREYDYVEVLAPAGESPRDRVANYAAEFLCQNLQSSKVISMPEAKLADLIRFLDARYLELYGPGASNVEIGLTGSKLQAVAAAVLSATRKIAQVWYSAPSGFDDARFSTGIDKTRIYEIALPNR